MCVVVAPARTTQPAWPDQWGSPPKLVEVVEPLGPRWLDVGCAWVPTWDLNAAAAAGWELKAAKAAGRFDFTTDGQVFQRSQTVAQCNQMAGIYRRRTATSAPVAV